MNKEQKRIIALASKWCESGYMEDDIFSDGDGGLCNALPDYYNFITLFDPLTDYSYWASETNDMYEFSDIRKMIVAFIILFIEIGLDDFKQTS